MVQWVSNLKWSSMCHSLSEALLLAAKMLMPGKILGSQHGEIALIKAPIRPILLGW
jgi:hypothetical protein